MAKFLDITGKQFGEWVATKYLGSSYWECKSSLTAEIKRIHAYSLKTDYLKMKSRGIVNKDLFNKKFGCWTVLKYAGNNRWECKCECGNNAEIKGYDLIHNNSTMCKECSYTKRVKDMTGKEIGLWTVLEYQGEGYWRCKCKCGTIKEVYGRNLRNGNSKSCGCLQDRHKITKDITGLKTNSLLVLGYTGRNNKWTCRCDCGNIKDIHRDSILTGKTKSCGCQTERLRVKTLQNKYGDTNTIRINNPREDWQIQVVNSKEALEEFMGTIKDELNVLTLSRILDINESSMVKILKRYELDSIVQTHSGESALEIEIRNYIKSLTEESIEVRYRGLIGYRSELDIYIPSKKIAIEINGTYWHSTVYKEAGYHQDKTIACAKQGIQLIHIFEYEWENEVFREKLKVYLKEIIKPASTLEIQSENTLIKRVSRNCEEYKNFLKENYIQANIIHVVNDIITLGCYNKDELLGVITFKKLVNEVSEVSEVSEYELLIVCWRLGYRVVGGLEKLLSTFIKEYKPKSIVTYVDISKFTGKAFTKLGFNTSVENITEPDYVLVSRDGEISHDSGLDTDSFFKIYNSGKLRFTWYK